MTFIVNSFKLYNADVGEYLMIKPPANRWYFNKLFWAFWIVLIAIGLKRIPARAQQRTYNPVPLPSNYEVSDTLSDQDIPTGEGGFARDYSVQLEESDQVAIDLFSDDFDSIVILLATDGSTVAENDDGPDGTTNSLLFARITEKGKYIIRVRAFGETGGGQFKLKLTRLRPIKD